MSMQKELIPLKEIIYEIKARDGTWCTLSYPGHPKGCKNFPQCPTKYPDFKSIEHKYKWFAVMVEFNLKHFAEQMRIKHPNMTENQSRCLLYWQPRVRKQLKQKAYVNAYKFNGDIVLEIPEACGVNVIITMMKAGVLININHPNIVKKIMLIGRKK